MFWVDGDVELSNNKESGRLCLKRSQLNRVTRTAGRLAGGRALAQFQVAQFVWFAVVAQFEFPYCSRLLKGANVLSEDRESILK